MTDVFDHPWLGGLFADEEMAALWSPEAQLETMRNFAAAWCDAVGEAGLVEAPAAEAAARAIRVMEFDRQDLRAGTARDGVVVPQLIRQMKAAAGGAGAAAVHVGATSQDLVDTTTAVAIRDSIKLIDARLAGLQSALAALDRRFGKALLIGRTRMQAAERISVSDRIATWLLPLAEHRRRLAASGRRAARVQVGGAVGDRRALGKHGSSIAARLAEAMDLGNPPRSWHAMRDGMVEFASCLSLVSGTLGKMGQDLALMAQQGLSEVKLAGGGGSSSMPHKQNPVLAELLVTLARYNAVQVSAMHQAMIHEQERSGAAWMLEWMVLPQMAMATGRSLTAALTLVASVERIGSAV